MTSWRRVALAALGGYLRHAPDHPGRWRLIDPAVSLAPALKESARLRTIRTREGFPLEIDGSSQTGRILYATGEYERETTRAIRRLLPRGGTMIDVGANIGYFTIVGARAVGATGHVAAFEPVAHVRARLERNIALNRLTNVSVRTEALADVPGRVEFFTGPADDSGLASLRELPQSTRVTVEKARLDDIWVRDRHIDLVKIDVEGAEMAALEGMRSCLERDAPHIVVEITDEYLRALGASAEALVDFLMGLGYAMYSIGHRALVPVGGPSELAKCPPQFNALFTRAKKVA